MPSRYTISTRDLTIEFADNSETADRRAGMNGVVVRHRSDAAPLFVPGLAGLNYEHVFDGQQDDRELHFEPRRAQCALQPLGGSRVLAAIPATDGAGVVLDWPPTPQWGLATRITLRVVEPDMVDAEYGFTPTRRSSQGDLLGVFFADYINQPEELGYKFWGHDAAGSDNTMTGQASSPGRGGAEGGAERVIAYASSEHGVLSTHRWANEPDYPPMGAISAHWMYASFSPYVFTRPYFWGEVRGLTALWMFDPPAGGAPPEGLRIAHSPSGGGAGNPAWDYIFLMPGYEVGRAYRWRSRLVYREMADAVTESARAYHEWMTP